MDSACPAASTASVDERRLASLPLLLCGDEIACLEHLAALNSDARNALERRGARALVLGIHIPDIGRPNRALKSRLRNARHTINTLLPRHPLVRHVIYALHLDLEPNACSPDTAVRLLFATVSAHHAEIEMRHGRDICITGIVTSPRTIPEAFAQRVHERIRTTPFEGSYATSWDEIADRSIGAAATEEFL